MSCDFGGLCWDELLCDAKFYAARSISPLSLLWRRMHQQRRDDIFAGLSYWNLFLCGKFQRNLLTDSVNRVSSRHYSYGLEWRNPSVGCAQVVDGPKPCENKFSHSRKGVCVPAKKPLICIFPPCFYLDKQQRISQFLRFSYGCCLKKKLGSLIGNSFSIHVATCSSFGMPQELA